MSGSNRCDTIQCITVYRAKNLGSEENSLPVLKGKNEDWSSYSNYQR
jgi:hypothetical protein